MRRGKMFVFDEEEMRMEVKKSPGAFEVIERFILSDDSPRARRAREVFSRA